MSNSLLVDDNDSSTPGDLDQLRKDLADATTQPEDKAEKKAEEPESELPEKYRGKTAAEIAEMHRNAESELGRRSNELGQYKKLTDELLDLKRRDDLAKGGADNEDIEEVELPKISSSDLLENPTEAIASLLEARDKSNQAKSERQRQKEQQEEMERKFLEAHPDAQEIVNSPEFVEWVQKSPARSLLGYNAANGDLVSGNALLAEYKANQTTDKSNEDHAPKEDTLEAAKKATTESAKVSNTPDTASGGKIYRRLDLIRLKLEDPEAYADEAFQQEIMKAYAEGRVK